MASIKNEKKIKTDRKIKVYLFALAVSSLPATLCAEARSKFAPTVSRLALDHEYIQKNKAHDYWALAPYYVSQRDGKSCSLGSLTMLANALNASLPLTSEDKLWTQDSLLKKVNNSAWKRDLGPVGFGVILKDLKIYADDLLKTIGKEKTHTVEPIYAEDGSTFESKLRDILAQNEKNSSDLIVANFDQGVLTGDPEGGGHISPIGAYDSKQDRVLIMDVDREWYEPYWVELKTLHQAINTVDKVSSKKRGILWIKSRNQ